MNPARFDLNQMLIFARVAELGQFSAAAIDLNLPKTTVSKRIQELEKRLGTPLLTRTTRKVRLTDAGARLYEHCAAALRELEAGERAVGKAQHSPSGMLRIGAPSSIGVSYLMPIMIAFQESYRDIQISALFINEGVDMAQANLDVLLQLGDAPHPGFAAESLGPAKTGLFASPGYLAEHGMPRQIADLVGHESVTGTIAIAGGNTRWPLRLANDPGTEVLTPLLSARFLGNDGSALALAALGGLGITILPIRYVADWLRRGQLVRVLPDWDPPPFELYAFFQSRSSLSLRARVFIDFMISAFHRLGDQVADPEASVDDPLEGFHLINKPARPTDQGTPSVPPES